MLLFGDIVILLFSAVHAIKNKDWIIFFCFLFFTIVLFLGNSLCFVVIFIISSQINKLSLLNLELSFCIFLIIIFLLVYLVGYLLEVYWLTTIIALISSTCWLSLLIYHRKNLLVISTPLFLSVSSQFFPISPRFLHSLSTLTLISATSLFISSIVENILFFVTCDSLFTRGSALFLLEKLEWKTIVILGIYCGLFLALDQVLIIRDPPKVMEVKVMSNLILRPAEQVSPIGKGKNQISKIVSCCVIIILCLLVVTTVNILPFLDNFKSIYLISGFYSANVYLHVKIIKWHEEIKIDAMDDEEDSMRTFDVNESMKNELTEEIEEEHVDNVKDDKSNQSEEQMVIIG